MADYETQNQPEYTDAPSQNGQSQNEQPRNLQSQDWQPRNGQPDGRAPYDPYRGSRQNSPYGMPQPPAPKKQNGFATASLVCGIFSLLNLCCFTFPMAIIMGVGAISFAVISRKGQKMSGPATAGTVLGAIAIVLGVLEFVYAMYAYTIMKDPENIAAINRLVEQLEQMMEQRMQQAQ